MLLDETGKYSERFVGQVSKGGLKRKLEKVNAIIDEAIERNQQFNHCKGALRDSRSRVLGVMVRSETPEKLSAALSTSGESIPHPNEHHVGAGKLTGGPKRGLGRKPIMRAHFAKLRGPLMIAGIVLALSPGAEAAASNEPVISWAHPGRKYLWPGTGDFLDMMDPWSVLQDYIDTGEALYYNCK